jgi:serine phosphatase RsbU (regulator of sigma subunit)/pSer/pThr/pTyr-binding forkhead associated (FHA) protein
MAILRIIKGNDAGRVYELKRGTSTIGRNPDSEIVLDHDAVSRPHAKVEYDGHDFFLEDLGSLNGTSVNQRPMVSGAKGRVRLRTGDCIKICGFQFVFDSQDPNDTSLVRLVDSRVLPRVASSVDLSSSSLDVQLEVNSAAKLRTMLAITEQLAPQLDIESAGQRILESLFSIFTQAERGLVVLRDPETGQLTPAAYKVRHERQEPVRVSSAIIEDVLRAKTALLTQDAAQDERFAGSNSVSDLGLHSLMCVPLLGSDGQAFGVIELDVLNRKARFRDEDLGLLACVARQLGWFVELARLHKVALDEQKAQEELRRIEHELDAARQMQRDQLPKRPPVIAGYQFCDVYHPAEQVGGDYYDFIYLPGDRLAVVVADVSGKGFSAALLMARFANETRQMLVHEPDPVTAIGRLNESVLAVSPEGKHITLLAAILDPKTHELRIVSAGHPEPLLRRADGGVEMVAVAGSGFPLGFFAESAYSDQALKLAPGECLLLFTDGVHEAKNALEEPYGVDRLRAKLAIAPGDDVRAVLQAVLDDIRAFVGAHRQSDDLCLIGIRRVA